MEYPNLYKAAVQRFLDSGSPTDEAEEGATEALDVAIENFAASELVAAEKEIEALSPDSLFCVLVGARLNDEGTKYEGPDGEGVIMISLNLAGILDSLFGE